MASGVLALGILMSALGAYAMYFGYQIVHDERGWASFIAGAVLLSGGLVTTVLALVLRTLKDLKAALVAPPAAAGRSLASEAQTPLAALAELEPSTPISPVQAESAFETAARPAQLSEPPSSLELAPSVAKTPTASTAASTPETLSASAFAERYSDEHQESADDFDAPVDPAEASSGGDPVPSDEKAEDLFDLSDLDRALQSEPIGYHASEEAVPPALQTVVAEPSIRPDSLVAAETASADVTETAAVGASLTPPAAVIGRYEAEGTSYVMYADGSIEAQSEAGVYRFSSMAELKTFLEG